MRSTPWRRLKQAYERELSPISDLKKKRKKSVAPKNNQGSQGKRSQGQLDSDRTITLSIQGQNEDVYTLENRQRDTANWTTEILFGYQKRWIIDNSPFKVWDKSRRVGASFCEALASVLAAQGDAQNKPMNTIYISYNREMTQGFIEDCATWAKAFNLGLAESGIENIVDEDKGILGFIVRFKNGRTIKALSNKAKNIRGKQARVVIDEAAFCDNLQELIDAAIALLMWGGQVVILSTHNGAGNLYKAIIDEAKSGISANGDRSKWSYHKTDIEDALSDGLYRRICQMGRRQWSPEIEKEWLEKLIYDYGYAARQELYCEPFSASAGKIFNKEWFEVIDQRDVPEWSTAEIRGWDMAATAKEYNKNACYTAGVKLLYSFTHEYYIVLDCYAEQIDAGLVLDTILAIAEADGKKCAVRWEKEGGSAGPIVANTLADKLHRYDADGIKPINNKLARATPFAMACRPQPGEVKGRVKLLRGEWNEFFLKCLHEFDGDGGPGKINDIPDAAAIAFNAMRDSYGATDWLRR